MRGLRLSCKALELGTLVNVPDRDLAALESYQLIPRVLHDVHEVDLSVTVLEQLLASPVVPLVEGGLNALETLSLVRAELLAAEKGLLEHTVPLLKTEKMGELMPKVRRLAAQGAPALALDFTVLADTAPYGTNPWRPKTREDLAELRAAAGCPIWLYGVVSPADALLAAEAGLEGIVVHSGAGFYLNGPATIEVFPEVLDAVAGMISVYAGGPVRSGIDVFRYLAVGAEAVIVESDRARANLESELAYAMRLTGCETVADIGYEAIFAPLFGEF